MKRIHTLILLATLPLLAVAQPKWLKKAQKSTATLYAIQQRGDTLSSPTFFVDAQGTAIVALAPLQQAREAWIIGDGGMRRSVQRIQGFDATYDIARVSTQATGNGKIIPLPLDTLPLQKTQAVYLMPRGQETQVAEVEKAGRYAYYTLGDTADFSLAGSPLISAEGQVVGIVQTPIRARRAPFFALDIRLPLGLSINAMDANHSALRESNIMKQLPNEESQARSFLYLLSATPEVHAAYAQDFIQQFPTQPTGYIQLAQTQLQQDKPAQANATFEQALAAGVSQADELHYARAQAIYDRILRNDSSFAQWDAAYALGELRRAQEQNDLPLYALLEARLQYTAGNFEEARQGFLALTATNMREANLFLYAAQCMERMGQPDSLILALNDSAVAMYSKPYIQEAAPYLWLRSQRLKQMGRNRDAIRDLNDYERLIEGQLSDAFYYQRYELEFASRMFPQAIADIERAIALNPNEPLYYAQQAVVLYRVGQLDSAIAACEKAVALDGTFPDAYRIWGICLRAKGQQNAAREKLQRAAELGDTMAEELLKQ